jgi:hypothetical protein
MLGLSQLETDMNSKFREVETKIPTMSAIMNLVYPVGSFYINTTNTTNPATLFGIGTWQRHSGLLWSSSSNDGNSTFHTNASTVNWDPGNIGGLIPGNLSGYRVVGWRRVG